LREVKQSEVKQPYDIRGPLQVSMRSLSVFVLLFLASFVSAQSQTDFTGHWQEKTNSGTQRHLEVQRNGRNLRARTVVTNSEGPNNLEVKYEIGCPETTYTGLDGDQFRSSLRWNGAAALPD
jgi:hypothetical protein